LASFHVLKEGKPMNLEEWNTVENAARALGTTYWILNRRLRREPGIPVRRVGNTRMIRIVDLARVDLARKAMGVPA
jgi:hypothetical protein